MGAIDFTRASSRRSLHAHPDARVAADGIGPLRSPCSVGFLAMLLVTGAAALLGASMAFEIGLAIAHTAISLYLYLATIVGRRLHR
jgi:hypothetical protein